MYTVRFEMLNKECVIFSEYSAAKIPEMIFSWLNLWDKMKTGGKLIWTASCQMPITGSGVDQGTTFTDIQCRFLCGHRATKPLILHNWTNGSNELLRLSYWFLILYAIYSEDLLCFEDESIKYLMFHIPTGTKYQNAGWTKRTCLLPPCHTQYKYVGSHQKNCQGGCFSIIVFIWRAFCCPKTNASQVSFPSQKPYNPFPWTT